ncbi:MAG: HAD-IIIA family hydrolase [Verrucomicrobiales bacterium]|jgi:D-glycero-D-manno-heptose 1,7-bisphosphate phosphatase|nr:HAD-IIIA family hydrolase [Verrucomicrobiales bacterium]
MNGSRAIFFDRDDTLIKNVPYLGDPSRVVLMPRVRENLPRLSAAGFALFLVSNQSGVGRGFITKAQVDAVNDEMFRQLGGNFFTGDYMCYAAPGQPDAAGERKPAPGLLFKARDEHGIDLTASVFVGDRLSDVQCGLNAGCRSVLLLHDTEDGVADRERARGLAHFVAEDFAAATEWILRTLTATV